MYCAKNKALESHGVKDLLQKYGSPLLIFDEATIKTRCKELRKVLDTFYPHARIAYSFKTNYTPTLILILKELGVSAEVVSDFEYWLAKKLGFEAKSIVFNGPDKHPREIQEVLSLGGIVNIDSFDEWENLSSFNLKGERQKGSLGLRVNTDIRPFFHKRFGFNLESDELFKISACIKEQQPKLAIEALHVHLGLGSTPDHFKSVAERLSNAAIRMQNEWGYKIKYLDFGGGFPIQGVRSDFGKALRVFPIREYVEGIADVLNKKFPKEKPCLILEPGRYLIDQAGFFAVTVVNTKLIKRVRAPSYILRRLFTKREIISELVQIATVNSSITSILKLPSKSSHIQIIPQKEGGGGEVYPTYIAGNSCISYDYLSKKIAFGRLKKGDVILFSNAGAYSLSRSEQFIHPRPAVILLKEDGGSVLVQKREAFEDMVK